MNDHETNTDRSAWLFSFLYERLRGGTRGNVETDPSVVRLQRRDDLLDGSFDEHSSDHTEAFSRRV